MRSHTAAAVRCSDGTGAGASGRRRRRLGTLLVAGALALSWSQAAPSGAASCGLLGLFSRNCNTPVTTPPVNVTVPPVGPLPPVNVTVPAVPIPEVVPAPVPAPAGGDVAGAAAHLLDLVNHERAAAGLGPLTMRDDVVAIAAGQSQAMAAKGTIWHNDDLFSTVVRTALGAGALGENVGGDTSADSVHARFMGSPHHRANILDGRFNVAGFAVAKAASGELFFTEDFVQAVGAPHPAAVRRAPAAPGPARPASPAAPTAAPRVEALPTTDTTLAPAPPPTVEVSHPVVQQEAPAPLAAAGINGPLRKVSRSAAAPSAAAAILLLAVAAATGLAWTRREA